MRENQQKIIYTPLGPMIAIADEHALYLLDFIDGKKLERKIKTCQPSDSASSFGIFDSLERQLNAFFSGKLKAFDIPICLTGSSFQRHVWEELQNLPYGTTASYLDIACAIGKPKAYRAVANANASNPLAVIIPCHRVICSGGHLGGYAGGISRKQQLLQLETINFD